MSEPVTMDATNWALLDHLQRDARLSYSELSRRLGLSPPAIAERVRRLQEAGVITGFHAHVDPHRVGLGIHAVVQMSCHGPRCVLNDPPVLSWPEVVSLERVTGGGCSVVRVMTSTMADLEALIDRLSAYGRPQTTMVLSTPLRWKPVPLAASGRGDGGVQADGTSIAIGSDPAGPAGGAPAASGGPGSARSTDRAPGTT